MNNLVLAAPIVIPLTTAFLLPLIERFAHRLVSLSCISAMLITLGILASFVEAVSTGEVLVYWMGGWEPRDGLAIGISLSVDAWGLLIALVVAVVGLMALIYSLVYMENQSGHVPYYVLMMLTQTALIGFCLSGDLFNQFVWLEVFSVAAFALTGFHVERSEAVEAAFKYLITNSVASFFIAIGLTLLYMQTGALNIAQIAHEFHATPGGYVAIGLLIGGYATKAALVPWHFWLPDAHSVAPSPVSALFSGALIKVGIYAVARSAFTLVPFQPGSIIQTGLLIVAALTMLVGGIQMLHQHSIKRVLAFSSVSQMGYIVLGFALGTPAGLAAAAMYVINHALLKTALFIGAGIVTQRANIHYLSEGGNLARQMPVTFGCMALAALGLSGMPFLSGFVSKTMLEEAADSAGFGLLTLIAIIASIFTFSGLARLVWSIFGTRPVDGTRMHVGEAHPLALLPIVVMVAGSVLIGSFPSWAAERFAWPASEALHDREHYVGTVMGIELTESEGTPVHEEAPPNPLDLHHWTIPLLILTGGSLLAYGLLHPEEQMAKLLARPIGGVVGMLRNWHSGLVTDYALWNAFGTAVMLGALVLGQSSG
jgi:multicomponent Na+:H+ antiporter subunit D